MSNLLISLNAGTSASPSEDKKEKKKIAERHRLKINMLPRKRIERKEMSADGGRETEGAGKGRGERGGEEREEERKGKGRKKEGVTEEKNIGKRKGDKEK